MKNTQKSYPIGEPEKVWDAKEKQAWLDAQSIKRSYHDDVLLALKSGVQNFEMLDYGVLCYGSKQYPQMLLKSNTWSESKPSVLITGGVHGYETSGVHGALCFAKDHAQQYSERVNFLIFPCVSPWSYETINRWNPHAIDPNRSFYENSPAQECSSVIETVRAHCKNIDVHFDLHETTDTDASEFTPALAARDGKIFEHEGVPDGFYLVADQDNYCPQFHKAMIDHVAKVTHIAPPDSNGNILGIKESQPGVIQYAAKKLHLCMAMTEAKYATTTEVYPDSPKVNPQNCIDAQVAAVIGGLEFLLK